MKVSSKIYKGIEFIQLSDLPVEQKDKIRSSLSEDSLIKILIEDTVVSNCIQYKDYEKWFDAEYKKPAPAVVTERFVKEAAETMTLAIGKV